MKFGLLWHSFSSGNLGVGALSISNMLLIDEAARKCGITPEFLIIGSSGPCDYPPSTERFNYESLTRRTAVVMSCDSSAAAARARATASKSPTR